MGLLDKMFDKDKDDDKKGQKEESLAQKEPADAQTLPKRVQASLYALLGLLNSSTACFWMKQTCTKKGEGGGGSPLIRMGQISPDLDLKELDVCCVVWE